MLDEPPLIVAEGADVVRRDPDRARPAARSRSCVTSSCSAAPARARAARQRPRATLAGRPLLHDALRIEPAADRRPRRAGARPPRGRHRVPARRARRRDGARAGRPGRPVAGDRAGRAVGRGRPGRDVGAAQRKPRRLSASTRAALSGRDERAGRWEQPRPGPGTARSARARRAAPPAGSPAGRAAGRPRTAAARRARACSTSGERSKVASLTCPCRPPARSATAPARRRRARASMMPSMSPAATASATRRWAPAGSCRRIAEHARAPPAARSARGERRGSARRGRVADLLVDAQRVAHALGASRSPARRPARSSGWPTWASTPSARERGRSRSSSTTTGMPGLHRAPDRAAEHARVGDRHDQAVGLRVDRAVDQPPHALEVERVGRPVVDRDVELRRAASSIPAARSPRTGPTPGRG